MAATLDTRVPCDVKVIRAYVLTDPNEDRNDDDLVRAANSAIARIEGDIGGPVLARDLTEIHDGQGRDTLFTLARPIVSITSLTINGVAQTGYAFNPRSGKVTLASGTFTAGTGNVVLVHRAGYEAAELPPDLVEAFLATTKWLYDERVTRTLGRLNVSVGPTSVSVAIKLPESIRLALRGYVDTRF